MVIHWANAKSLVHNGHTFIHTCIYIKKLSIYIYIYIYIVFVLFINESIVLGLDHSLGGNHVPLLDSAINMYLPRFYRPLGKVQAIGFETYNFFPLVRLLCPTSTLSLIPQSYFLYPYAYQTIVSLSVDELGILT
jgi:hypothetical protein